MHLFQQRLEQLLTSVDGLSDGRRQRLSRPLRQADIRCWERPDEEAADAALLACSRTLAHELLDALALHLEAALTACRSLEVRLLLAAIAARETILGRQVRFLVDGQRLGCAFLSDVQLTLAPNMGTDEAELQVEVTHGAGTDAVPVRRFCMDVVCTADASAAASEIAGSVATIRLAPTEIRQNPFAAAAEVGQVVARWLGELPPSVIL